MFRIIHAKQVDEDGTRARRCFRTEEVSKERKGLYVRVMVFWGGGTEEVFLSAGDSMGATGVCVGC